MNIDWEKRWPNFKPTELLSPSGLLYYAGRQTLFVQPHFIDFLQAFRTEIGKSFLINHGNLKYRGYRSPKENQQVGGTENSLHVQGLAVDVTIPGIIPEKVGQLALDFGFTGVGVYETFTHLDIRTKLNNAATTWSGVSG